MFIIVARSFERGCQPFQLLDRRLLLTLGAVPQLTELFLHGSQLGEILAGSYKEMAAMLQVRKRRLLSHARKGQISIQ